jgi:hypothetical protein
MMSLALLRFGKPVAGITMVVLAVVLSWPAYSLESELGEDDPFDFSSLEEEETLDPNLPEINEPFFSMVLQWAADDSLGNWTGADVLAYAEALGRPSKFPLEKLISFSRHHPQPQDSGIWPQMNVKAIWEVELTDDLDSAMPYSILGYHPGTLRISGKIIMSEVHLGAVELKSVDGNTRVQDIQLFRLEKGTLILDVDGWLDALLGKRLDDAAMLGCVAAREDGNLIGLAVSVGEKGRSIYGEIDFKRDKILANGRPVASALSRSCRSLFIQGMEDPLAKAWGR